MATKVRVVSATMTTDTSTFDVVAGGGETRNPTGVIVFASFGTVLDTLVADSSRSFGLSDFTTQVAIGTNNQDNEPTITDARSGHSDSLIINLPLINSSSVDRSATVTAISGGVRFTPVQSGTAYLLSVTLIFGAACKAFSSVGDGALAVDETFAITHGLGVAPKAGIYGYTQVLNTYELSSDLSIGFHTYLASTIKQRCHAMHSAANQTVTRVVGYIATDRVGIEVQNNQTEVAGAELTAISATTCTYTNRISATTTNPLIGLLIDFDDVTVFLESVPTPITAASDWNYNALSFTPQAAMGLITRLPAEATYDATDLSGTTGWFVFDEAGGQSSISQHEDDNITLGNTVTGSLASARIRAPNQSGGVMFDFQNPTFTADGFDVTAANILDMDTTIRYWPTLFIEAAAAGGGTIAPISYQQYMHNTG